MSETPLTCPRCHSSRIVKNGFIHNGNQNFKCKVCNRQFVQNPTKKVIGQETRDLIDKLLLERVSLAGIASSYWSFRAMVAFHMSMRAYSSVSKVVEVWQKKKTIDNSMR